ncbi:hypothetical protein CGZ91_10630 [Parenemella sanctibonifatiensis]|uniref:Uncharacterized protein n=1 Tax=Parenemella sanctibonifatiensis TaxID=2016505 RepID=A0A255EEI9_9ACTN|nr:hypothetical protein CGZ91_10630 [Parenemella sanctibonifatiensis]
MIPWGADFVGCGGEIIYTCTTDRDPSIVVDDVRAAAPDAMVRRLAEGGWEEIYSGEFVIENWDDRAYALVGVRPAVGPSVEMINPLFGLEDGSLELAGGVIISGAGVWSLQQNGDQ